MVLDVLVIGTGPAGLAIASQLGQRGLTVGGLSPTPPDGAWQNTYGIWCDELDALGLKDMLAHRWDNCVGYFGAAVKSLDRSYGLFDKQKLQAQLLNHCDAASVTWHEGSAAHLTHEAHGSTVTTTDGRSLQARLVVDATGHKPAFIQRSAPYPPHRSIAYQAAYGVVGRFSCPPVEPGQFVLMDYRADHLSPQDRQGPPTFLYAMDLGGDCFFVEETSLADCPGVPFDVLKSRLHQRLAYYDCQLQDIHEEEYCLFPMNAPMPSFDQAVVGFGGSASMVHPATGYMVGALLRRAPELAEGIVSALEHSSASSTALAAQAWSTLWSSDRLRKYYIYLFGLENLMRFDHPQLCRFFDTFFSLPQAQWSGFLADTLTPAELVGAMLNLFGTAPNGVRWHLMQSIIPDGELLWRSLNGLTPSSVPSSLRG